MLLQHEHFSVIQFSKRLMDLKYVLKSLFNN